LIVSVVSYKVYTKEEINNKLEKYEILNCLNILCNYCIHRFVVDEYDILSVQYHDYFSNLDTEKIIETCDEFYSLFEVYTNPDIKKNIWNEILRCSITNYIIKLVILSENQMIKGIEDIKKKIQNDNVIFLRFYSNKIGLESTQEILKNLDYYLEFLESSPDMICLPCQSLREFNGDSFTIQKVKILMNLRFDFTAKQKQEAIETCIEVFTNCKEYKKDKNTNQLYNYIVEKRNRKKKKQNSKYEKNLESLNDDCNTLNFQKHISKEELKEFGIDVSDSEDEQDHMPKNEKNHENFFVPKENKYEKGSMINIIHEGEMKKKSNTV